MVDVGGACEVALFERSCNVLRVSYEIVLSIEDESAVHRRVSETKTDREKGGVPPGREPILPDMDEGALFMHSIFRYSFFTQRDKTDSCAAVRI
jgi:hypothetical protein